MKTDRVLMSIPLCVPVISLAAVGSAPAEPPFQDPAPPIVRVLEPMPAPSAAAHPELTFHTAPQPLLERAITEDWPGFLGPRRNGQSTETHLRHDWGAEGPQLVWEMECGDGYSCPVVQGEKLVYTHRIGGEAHIDCLNAETGQRYWRLSYPSEFRGPYISDNGPRSTPIIDEDRVYVHGIEGVLHCLDLATGRVIWKRDISGEFGIADQFFGVVASPLIYGDLLIQNIGAPAGPCVAAFNKLTGQMVWGVGNTWGPSCASPVIAELGGKDRLFVMTGGDSRPPTGGLMVIDPGSGELEFEYPFRSRTYESVNGASPVVTDDRVFISASYGVGTACLALSPGGWSELWKIRSVGLQFSNPLYVDGYLYAIDGRSDRSSEIVCLNPSDGTEVSRTDLSWDETLFYNGADKVLGQSVGEGSLLYVDGQALCLGDNGHLLWLELQPAGVKVLARTSLFRANESWSPPALSRGLLYVCQNKKERFGREPAKARLMCFDLRER